MYTTVVLVLLAGLLTWPLPTFSAPRQAVSPPAPAGTLTAEELTCQLYGEHMLAAAKARDGGVPYLQQVKIVRRGGLDPAVQTYLLTLTRSLYDLPLVTPSQAQQLTELGCLKSTTAATLDGPGGKSPRQW